MIWKINRRCDNAYHSIFNWNLDRLDIPAGQYWQHDATVPTNRSRDEQWNEGIGVSGGHIAGRALVLTSPDQFPEVA